MDARQALAILDQAAALAPLQRQDHARVLEAVDTLAKIVSPGDNTNVTRD